MNKAKVNLCGCEMTEGCSGPSPLSGRCPNKGAQRAASVDPSSSTGQERSSWSIWSTKQVSRSDCHLTQEACSINLCEIFTCCWWARWRVRPTAVEGRSPARSVPGRSSCPAGEGAGRCGRSLTLSSRWLSLRRREKRVQRPGVRSQYSSTVFFLLICPHVNNTTTCLWVCAKSLIIN